MGAITVNTTIDELDGSIIDGDISLRDAIAAAAPGESIMFDPTVFGADTDPLTNTAIALTLGTLVLTQDVTINGDTNGDGIADVTIDGAGNGNNRMVRVDGAIAAFESLTFANANATGQSGAAVYVDTGGSLNVLSSSFMDNETTVQGGAIRVHSGAVSATITNSSFLDNESSGRGGAISSASTLTVTNSTFSGNASTSTYGGAIYIDNAAATILNSTLAGNSASGGGGAIAADGGTLNLTNSTITGNVAGPVGGGGVIIDGNGVAAVTNTIILGNFAPGAVGVSEFKLAFGAAGYDGVNIIGDGTGNGDPAPSSTTINAFATDVFAATVDNNGRTAGVLADNSGPVQTVALRFDASNPALDRGKDSDAPVTDARGQARADFPGVANNGANISDIGAFELQAALALVVTTVSDSGEDATVTGDIAAETADGGGLSLREALQLALPGGTVSFDESIEAATIRLGGALVIAAGADLTIDGDSDGDGNRITISGDSDNDGSGDTRLMTIASGATLSIENATLTKGFEQGADGADGGIADPNGEAGEDGVGGISNAGTLSLTDVTLSHNTGIGGSGGIGSPSGGGGYGNTGDSGGGFGAIANTGSLTLDTVSFDGNTGTGTVGVGGRSGNGGFANSDGGNGSDGGDGGDGAADIFNGAGGTVTFAGSGIALLDSISTGRNGGSGGVGGQGSGSGYFAGDGGDGGDGGDAAAILNAGAIGAGTILSLAVSGSAGTGGIGGSSGTATGGASLGVNGADGADGAFANPILNVGAGTSAATLADIVVDTAVDEDDGDFSAGDLSLREAIGAAAPGATIRFDGAVFGADGDELNNTAIALTLGKLVLSQGVTINGDTNGDGVADVTIDGSGNGDSRIFEIAANTTGVALESLTISGANASVNGTALFAYDNSEFRILNSTFDNNTSTAFIGAVIGVRSGVTGVIANSAVTNNTSGSGAVDVSGGTLTVVNSTLSGNHSTTALGLGAAIQSFNSTVDIINSTITGNHADGYGAGGIYRNAGGTLSIANSIIAGNSSASGNDDVSGTITSNGANIFGSAVTGSTGGDVTLTGGAGLALTDVFASVSSKTVGGATFDSGDLADNGGPTRTVDILNGGLAEGSGLIGDVPNEGSLGIDVNRNGVLDLTPVDIDQRGGDRQVDTIDIGAVEQFTTFVVNTTVDELDGSVTDGDVSLRDAVAAAADGDRIVFDGGVFTANDDPLSNIAITLSMGEIFIDDGITIDGDTNGDGIADVTLDGTGTGARLLNVATGTTGVALESLTLANTDNALTGGALFVASNAEVTILNASFDNNTSTQFGSIRASGSGTTLTIANSTFTGNASRTGAIDSSGTTTLVNSTLYGNRATDATLGGGAIYITSGTTGLYNTTITGNYSAGDGGGIFNDAATLNVTNSIIAGNSAAGTDNDIHNDTAADAVSSSNGANIFGSTVTGSVAGDVTLTGGAGNALSDVFATVTNSSIGGSPAFDHGTLADNGGPTRTVDIKQSGLAHNNGKDADIPTESSLGLDVDRNGAVAFSSNVDVDQRGADRTVGTVDIGAVELVQSVVVTTTEEADGDLSAGDLSLREALSIVADGGTVTFDPILFAADADERVNTTIALIQGTIGIGTDVTIDGDTNGDGVADVTIDGGGLGGVQMFQVSSGSTTFKSLTFDGGQNSYGIKVASGGTVRVENSTFVNNYGTYGGAIANLGTTQVIGSTFADNTADGGGAIYSNNGMLDVLNSTFYGNLAKSSNLGGGAIYSANPFTVTNSTITGNYADTRGGGLEGGGSLTLDNSIVAGNGSAISNPEIRATLTSNGSNIFGAGFSGTTVGGDLILGGGTDLDDVFDRTGTVNVGGGSFTAGLLGSNGGSVDTVALLASAANPALDAAGQFSEASLGIDFNGDGDTLDLVDKDGRGFNRTVDIPSVANDGMTFADIGAFETQGVPTPGPDFLIGTAQSDLLDGLAGSDRIETLAGDDAIAVSSSLPGDVDLIDGGEGFDLANFAEFNAAVWAALSFSGVEVWTQDDTNATDGAVGGPWREIVDLANIEYLGGTDFSDFLAGDGGNNSFFYNASAPMLGGLDVVDGGTGGSDTADFSRFNAAVWASLAYSGAEVWTQDDADATDGLVGGVWRAIADLANIDNVAGTDFSDFFAGDSGDNTFFYTASASMLGGLDDVDGGSGGSNTADFSRFNAAVWASLAYSGTEVWTQDDADATDGLVGGVWRAIADLANVHNVAGTDFSDFFVGDSGDNTFFYTASAPMLGGLDVVDGGSSGSDTADFSTNPFAVWVHLAFTGPGGEAWTQDDLDATDGSGGAWRITADLDNVENVTGSEYNDLLGGDDGGNILRGLDGNDTLSLGRNTFVQDTLDGGDGFDIADFSEFESGVWASLLYSGVEVWTQDDADATDAPGGGSAWRAIADLNSIEDFRGSDFSDLFIGDAVDTVYYHHAEAVGGGGLDDLRDVTTLDFGDTPFGIWAYLDSANTQVWTQDDADATDTVGTWREVADLGLGSTTVAQHVLGSAFDDELRGDSRDNELEGRDGNDIFGFALNYGNDEIFGFQDTGSGFEDVLDFRDNTAVNSIADVTIAPDATGTTVTTSDGSIRLHDVTSGIEASDFLFT